MNKRREKVLFSIMVIQSAVIGGIYLYAKVEKWNLEVNMTIFLYPLSIIMVIFLMIVSVVVSFCYFINKLLSVHKLYFCIPLLITIILFLVSNEFFNEMKLREYNFEKYQGKREEIVELVLQGKLTPDENGVILLPERLKDEEMARGGYVTIVKYGAKTGIYFCTFPGLLESTAGYIYLTDEIFDVDIDLNTNVILQSECSEKWYFCGTD